MNAIRFTAQTTLALACTFSHCIAATLAETTFDAGPSGWRILDFSTSGQYLTPSSTLNVTWSSSGGSPGGHIFAADPTMGIFLFDAPTNFHGDFSAAYGGVLEFDLASTRQDWTNDNVVVLVGRLTNGVQSAIVAQVQPLPTAAWGHYAIGLVARKFRLHNKQGPPVSLADFRSVLSNVVALRISGEYGSVVVETTRLDSVRITTQSLLSIQCFTAVTLDGLPDHTYRIEYVENLGDTNWRALTTVTVTTTPYIYYDLTSIESPQRFYRAVEIP